VEPLDRIAYVYTRFSTETSVERVTGDATAESRTSSPNEAATEERAELLATKLNIQQPRQDQLRRSRLIDRLNEGMAQKLITVCTPAGFGKTSLLAEWAANTKWAVAWLAMI
jgi:hypothetical protein